MLRERFIINNDQAEREFNYLITIAKEEDILIALEQLGNRKPFPLNILKLLKIKIDYDEINKADKETVLNYLDDLQKMLNKSN